MILRQHTHQIIYFISITITIKSQNNVYRAANVHTRLFLMTIAGKIRDKCILFPNQYNFKPLHKFSL